MSLQTTIQNWVYKGRYDARTQTKKSWRWLWVLVLIVVLLLIWQNATLRTLVETLTPPQYLPALQTKDKQGKWLPQQWLEQGETWVDSNHQPTADTRKYHYLTQGSTEIPIPYDWFLNLEQPNQSVWSYIWSTVFFSKKPDFHADDYLLRFGFIRGKTDPVNNPDGLPIGFSKTLSANLAGYPHETEALGFTCSACHTGHFVAEDKGTKVEYIVEGAPANTDVGQLTSALTAALVQTALSSKIPLFDGRFNRFAKNVLGKGFTEAGKVQLAKDLQNVLLASQKNIDIIEVQEGFTRLDALNRIGNQVFSQDLNWRNNYHPIQAPVTYPHIWTSSWFDWVQYDGSIMGPLIRNAGEAMGLHAEISFDSPKKDNRFDSSIPVLNLWWIEEFLAGKPPLENQKFTGLLSPHWPENTLGTIDTNKHTQGKQVYDSHCARCHLPALNDTKIWEHFYAIKWNTGGKTYETQEKVLKLKIIPQARIGTDPGQGAILPNRTVNTAGNDLVPKSEKIRGMGIKTTVCGRDMNQLLNDPVLRERWAQGLSVDLDLVDVPIRDGGKLNFGLALGALVQQTIGAWYKSNGISSREAQWLLENERPNCLQVGWGYKARPLNGIWATAPFLHNGSVATVKDLVCKDVDERPRFVQLGDIAFDKKNIGLAQPKDFQSMAQKQVDKGKLYTKEGYFILDTSTTGNHNSGHYFSSQYDPDKARHQQPSGVIGPKLNSGECDALLEYIKTL